MLSLLYGPTLTSVHDYWKNRSFDYAACQQPWVTIQSPSQTNKKTQSSQLVPFSPSCSLKKSLHFISGRISDSSFHFLVFSHHLNLTCWYRKSGCSAGKESACNAGDLGSKPGLGRSPGEQNGYPLQYSDLENSMNCIVHGVAKSWTQLRDFHFHRNPPLCRWPLFTRVSQCMAWGLNLYPLVQHTESPSPLACNTRVLACWCVAALSNGHEASMGFLHFSRSWCTASGISGGAGTRCSQHLYLFI